MQPEIPPRRPFSHLALAALLATAYFAAGKLGLQLALVHEDAAEVWPPAGIALAALVLWGYRLWPGVLIGAILVHATTGEGITVSRTLASLGIATGNTLQGLLGACLMNRFARGRQAFDRPRDVVAFAVLSAIPSTAVGATSGAISLTLAGLATWAEAPAIWITRWIGHAGGDLVLAPPLILWAVDWRLRWSRARALEAGLLLVALGVPALAAFTTAFHPGPHVGLAFLCTPALLWAAFRFGQRETASVMALLSGIAVWGALHGLVAGSLSPTGVSLELQAYLGVGGTVQAHSAGPGTGATFTVEQCAMPRSSGT